MTIERILLLASLGIAIFLAVDLTDDIRQGGDLTHIIIEGAALILSASVLTVLISRLFHSFSNHEMQLRKFLAETALERKVWKARSNHYLRGLSQAINQQFDVWNLTPSEREVGLLILKGFSHKEIAALRGTSERTVRQEAASLYDKANLDNKSQLSAFFLEDLMLLPTDKEQHQESLHH